MEIKNEGEKYRLSSMFDMQDDEIDEGFCDNQN
jgi:hypothetical protein